MILHVPRMLSPQPLRYFQMPADGRDQLVWIGGELWFYRDGANETGISITCAPPRGRLRSTHPLVPARRPRVFLLRPIEPDHDYMRQRVRVVWDLTGEETPKARIHPARGVMYINLGFWSKLPVLWRKYIVYHELAHLLMSDEAKTDILATLWYTQAGYPLSQAIMCLKYAISDENPEKDRRGAFVVESFQQEI